MGILGGLIDSRITLSASPMSPSQEAFISQKKGGNQRTGQSALSTGQSGTRIPPTTR